MAIFDMTSRSILLKIVYYGCALSGKTTNLITLHRLSDPEAQQGLVSVATKNDRTLFFDLLPMDLGQVGGLTVRVKVYTVPGQVHYEVTRRQVLAGVDGVVMVVDSAPATHEGNLWSMENLRHNLKRLCNGPSNIPITLQWNKRDLPDAVDVGRLAESFNKDGLPAFESVATTGVGVLETFACAVKAAVRVAYEKSGRAGLDGSQLDETIDKALMVDIPHPTHEPEPSVPSFEHRFDSDAYRDEWADLGRDRQIVDQETLLSEAVQTSMELAEKLDGTRVYEELGERRGGMLHAVALLQEGLADPAADALPAGLMGRLLQAGQRTRGSLLLASSGKQKFTAREVVPAGDDPLDSGASEASDSAAYWLSQGNDARLVEDLRAEVFFENVPPAAEDLQSCLLVPVACDGARFGTLAIYATTTERPFGAAERSYWNAAARALGLGLHWRALRKRLAAR